MSDIAETKMISRRTFIKGVIASGAAVSSAGYLFRASILPGQTPAVGAGERLITINANGQQRRGDDLKQKTLAWTLRNKLGPSATKLGYHPAECCDWPVL